MTAFDVRTARSGEGLVLTAPAPHHLIAWRKRRVPYTSTNYNYSFDPSGNVVQRHTAGASTLADFTTLYYGFGQQIGCIDTITGSQASAASGEMIGFPGQFGCWTDKETYTTASGGAPQRRFPWFGWGAPGVRSAGMSLSQSRPD